MRIKSRNLFLFSVLIICIFVQNARAISDAPEIVQNLLASSDSPVDGGTSFSLPDASSLNQFQTDSAQGLIGLFIRAIMSIVGSLALVMYIYAGFLWMSSRGEAEKIGKAGQIFLWTTLGLVALFASYAAVSFLLGSF